MKLDELRKLIARGEDSRLQFKADVNNADALAAEMAAPLSDQINHLKIYLIYVKDRGVLGLKTTFLAKK